MASRKRTAGNGSYGKQEAARYTKYRRPTLHRTANARGRAALTAGVELKFHDIDWDESAADLSAGVISNTSSLVLIGQGVTESTRIGRKAVLKSIGWRARVQLGSTEATVLTTPETVRFLLVLDKQCNGAAPAVAGANGLLESANYQSFNNLTNKGRFSVLADKTLVLNPQAASGNGSANDTGAVTKTFSVFKKCDIPVEYSGTAAPSVIDEVRTNNVFGIMITETANASLTLDSKFRFRFTDS